MDEKLITIDGKTKNISNWLKVYGLSSASLYRRIKEGMTIVEALTSAKKNHEKKFYSVELTFDEIAYLSRRCRKSVYTLINKGASIHQILMLPKYSKTASQQNRISDELSAFGIVY